MSYAGYSFSVEISALIALGWFIVGIFVGYQISLGREAGGNGRQSRRRDASDDVEIYVGNLSYDVSERDLQKAFEVYGKVSSARIIKNRFNGKSKGFGFVEMADRGQSMDAVRALNGKDLKGRRIVVNEAKSSPRD